MSRVPNKLILLSVVSFLWLSDAFATPNPPPPKVPPPPGLPLDNWVLPVLLLAGIYGVYKIIVKKKDLKL